MLLSIWGHLFPPLGLRRGTTATDTSEEKCLPTFLSTRLLQNQEAPCFELIIISLYPESCEKSQFSLERARQSAKGERRMKAAKYCKI